MYGPVAQVFVRGSVVVKRRQHTETRTLIILMTSSFSPNVAASINAAAQIGTFLDPGKFRSKIWRLADVKRTGLMKTTLLTIATLIIGVIAGFFIGRRFPAHHYVVWHDPVLLDTATGK